MLSNLRKHIATSASGIDAPEIFPWNRWLRVPKHEFKAIEKFYLAHYDTSQLVLKISGADISRIKHNIFVRKVENLNNFTTLSPAKCSRVYFGMVSTKTEHVSSKISLSKVDEYIIVAQDRDAIYLCNKINKKEEDVLTLTPSINKIEFVGKKITTESIEFNIAAKHDNEILGLSKWNAVSISKDLVATHNYYLNDTVTLILDFEFKHHYTKNVEISFQPKIIDVDVLSSNKLQSENRLVKINNIDILKDKTKIEKVDILNSFTKKTYFLKNINISPSTLPSQYDVSYFETLTSQVELNKLTSKTKCLFSKKEIGTIEELSISEKQFTNQIEYYLEPGAQLKENSISQKRSSEVEFLVNNNFALLELNNECNKYEHSLNALRKLLIEKKAKNILIITDQYLNNKNFEFLSLPSGWLGHIKNVLSEISTTIIKGTAIERELLWKNPSQLTIVSYNNLFEDVSTLLVDSTIIKRFDCLIFDEAEILLNKSLQIKTLLNSSQPKYVWSLTSLPLSLSKEELYSSFASFIKLNRAASSYKSNADVVNTTPHYSYNWCKMDDFQKQEYMDALNNGVLSLIEFSKTGNPYRFQANVYSLLHQLKRISNSSSNSSISNKIKNLIKQTKKIQIKKEKVLIFTQYEKQGSQIIEKALEKEGISFQKFLQGSSPQQLKKAISEFENDTNCTAFIFGAKVSRSITKLPKANIVIHFDKWWNPASYWSLENNLITSNTPPNEIITYFVEDSIDELLEETLWKKGLLNKDFLFLLSSEIIREIISDEEWLRILLKHLNNFGLKLDAENQDYLKLLLGKNNKKNEYNVDSTNLKERTEKLLLKLGLSNIKVTNGTPGIYEYLGEYKLKDRHINFCAKTYFNESVDPTLVAGYCNDLLTTKTVDKILILLPEYLTKEELGISNVNLSVITQKSLLNYLKLFKL